MSEALPQVILDSEKAAKVDPWLVDVEEELRRLLRLLGEKINFFICGIAAENSALIHWKKVEEIMRLRERIKRVGVRRAEEPAIDIGELPSLQVLWSGRMTLIDLSDILSSLMEFLEEMERRKVETTMAAEPLPTLEDDFIRRMHVLSMEVLSVIKRLFELYGEEIGFIDLTSRAEGLKAVEIFILILFLYTENLINIRPLEGEDGMTDLIISPGE
ncbi:MAG: hypothetical protein ACE5GD_03855 [Candidatus Geothermarchaeales archaeon]